MDLFIRLKRNQSSLISNKTVVFLIRQKQIFIDFSETTKIKSLKKYITNRLNNKYLDLLYNGHTVNNEMDLNDLCNNNQKIRRLFFQVIDKKEAKLAKEEEIKINNYKNEIIEMNNNNSYLNNELLKLKEENNEKNREMQNSTEKCNDINKIYEKQEEEIHQLKKELSKINNNIDEINKINMDNKKYLIENKELKIIGDNKAKTANNSIVHLASVYTIEGKNNNSSNNNKQLNYNTLKKQGNNSIDNSTMNTNNYASLNNSENAIDSTNASYAKTPDKKLENKNKDIIKEVKEVIDDKELIKKGYNPKNIEINLKTIDKDLSIKDNNLINSIKKWFIIFKYLDIKEQLLFSITNKENCNMCFMLLDILYI
jgi:hypothetical protein